ncbi:hypothetical protein FBU59_000578 [Linderina macrospora]|uniref:Uncharacterized protein n=1 Tax=Linderina macrospora TaxID=4868 RepID=A0ACC1JGK0_9FUNG|nr:hypothetical protein FBU59_000578 [Linderina macrospora]
MLDEVIRYLSPQDGKAYLDGTFGEGGYTKRMLDTAACTVAALDQDPTAIDKAKKLAALYPDRLSAHWMQFGDLGNLQRKFDGIVLDVGVSSGQIASEDRGFSFQLPDSPLDMRMSYSHTHGALTRLLPAHAIVNQFSVDKLTHIFRTYGQERHAKAIAKEIERRRATAPITTTGQLVEAVLAAVPKGFKGHKGQIHPATRVFQSLRIEVNDELGQLSRALDAATGALNPGGRLVVVSFHSLEDTVVKKRFRAWTDAETVQALTRKVVTPSEAEVSENPRSRSAKLRAIELL